MAYLFNGATHIINRADAVLQTWPITLHGRVRLSNSGDGLTHNILYLSEAASHNGFRILVELNTGTMKARCGTRAGGVAANGTTTTSISDSNWHSVIGEITSATARQVWLDNAGNGSNATSLTPGTLTKTVIGAQDSGGSLSGNVGHDLADLAVWSGTLTADERASLAAGVSPLLIRPDILEIYLPLMRGATDYMGSAFTVTNATVSDHPRVYMPGYLGVVKTASGTQNLTPSLFSNTNSFFAPTVAAGAVDLTPGLFSNTNSFPAATVSSSYDLTPGLFSETNSFHSATIAPGAVALTPSLYTNSNTFFTQTVSASYTITPSLFTNSNSFFTHTVTAGAVNLAPSLFTNTNTFYSPTVSLASGTQNLAPSIFTNSNSFFTPTVAPGAVSLAPALFTNTNTFFAPTVTSNKTLSPPLFTSTNSFFSPSVQSTYALIASLFGNTNTFFGHTITGGELITDRRTGLRPADGVSTLRLNLSGGSRPSAISRGAR